MFCVNHRPAAVADWWSIHQPTAAGGGGRRRAEQVGRHACQSPDRVRRVVHAGARSSGARKNGAQYATAGQQCPRPTGSVYAATLTRAAPGDPAHRSHWRAAGSD